MKTPLTEAVPQRDNIVARLGKITAIALALGGACFLLVLVHFISDELSGRRRFITGRDIVLYYVIPAAISSILFASLKLKNLARLRMLMCGLAIGLSVYAVDLLLVVAGDTRPRPVMDDLSASRNKERYAARLSQRFGTAIDIRTPGAVIADLHTQGIDAIPIVTASNHLFVTQSDGSVHSTIKVRGAEVVPLASVSKSVTLLCNEDGRWMYYPSDSRGFNNPDEVWTSTRLEIAAIGDSFAHGYCVPRGRSFVDLIRNQRPATLNLGMAGDGPLLMLATMTEFLPRFAPKVVLWLYFEGNDLKDLQVERRSPLLKNYLMDGFATVDLTRQDDVDRAILAEIPRLERVGRDNLRRRGRNEVMNGLIEFVKLTSLRDRISPLGGSDPELIEAVQDFNNANMQVFREIMALAKARAEGWDGQLYFVYLPEWARYTPYTSWGKDKRDDVLEVIRGLRIPIIDVQPVFQAHGDPLSLFPFREDGHYTEAGHRLVAEEVQRRLAIRPDAKHVNVASADFK